ncbi:MULTISPECIES: hypothetical protein [Oxalobacteraceae]|uniref:hypothetical protein n=1 Tax=Herminiimonas sp. Marseille-P9896 TaxID=2742211 RepID=UPI00158BBC52|nr:MULTISPECIES: hypothetical protein [Oxalobacteraceae]
MTNLLSSTAAPDYLAVSSSKKQYAAYAAVMVMGAMALFHGHESQSSFSPLTLSEKPLTDAPKYLLPVTTGFSGSLSAEIAKWIENAKLNLGAVDHLVAAIHSVFGKVEIAASLHVDPDEAWEKLVLHVNSGLEDYDAVMALEDKLFAKVDADAGLRETLKSVVITQV